MSLDFNSKASIYIWLIEKTDSHRHTPTHIYTHVETSMDMSGVTSQDLSPAPVFLAVEEESERKGAWFYIICFQIKQQILNHSGRAFVNKAFESGLWLL